MFADRTDAGERLATDLAVCGVAVDVLLAVTVGSPDSVDGADEVVVLETPGRFGAVGSHGGSRR